MEETKELKVDNKGLEGNASPEVMQKVKPKVYIPDIQDPSDALICDSCQ